MRRWNCRTCTGFCSQPFQILQPCGQLRFALGQELLSFLDNFLLSLDASLGALHELQTRIQTFSHGLHATLPLGNLERVPSEVLRLGCRLPTNPKRPANERLWLVLLPRVHQDSSLVLLAHVSMVTNSPSPCATPLANWPTLQGRGLPSMH